MKLIDGLMKRDGMRSVRGYCYWPDDQMARVLVDFRLDGRLVGTVRASWIWHGIHDNRHGFYFELSAITGLDGKRLEAWDKQSDQCFARLLLQPTSVTQATTDRIDDLEKRIAELRHLVSA